MRKAGALPIQPPPPEQPPPRPVALTAPQQLSATSVVAASERTRLRMHVLLGERCGPQAPGHSPATLTHARLRGRGEEGDLLSPGAHKTQQPEWLLDLSGPMG